VQPWKQFLASKSSSKKLAWAGAAAGGVVLIVAGAFLFQQWQIMRLESQWRAMEPKVKELTAEYANIKQYRPWYDRSFRALRIMREVVQAFPQEGYVSAKTFEIRDLASVTCSGVANNNQSYISLFDKLRVQPDVAELKTENLRGQSPVQFTLNFQWAEGGQANGN